VSDLVKIALIAAFPGIVSSILAYMTNRRVAVTQTVVETTAQHVEVLKKQTDGIQSSLLAVTAQSEHAKGVKEGADAVRAELK
jgi:hypothetical protein